MTHLNSEAAIVHDKSHAGMIVKSAYGKSKVRLTKVSREGDRHELKEICVDISLEGSFHDTYTTGDNSNIIATDSMKNTVYVLAAQHPLKNIESFATTLATHFISRYEQVDKVTISIAEELWQRIHLKGEAHAHAFSGAGAEKRTTKVEQTREQVTIESGITDLRVVKTTNSAFEGFIRDQYTTLPETKDRIFGTSISAVWQYASGDIDFNDAYLKVREIVLEIFAEHMSLSVQQTLHEIGQEALKHCPYINEISLTMPNEHRIPFVLHHFGVDNKNEISITTAEPYGLITATIARTN
jgi:urate oxidase